MKWTKLVILACASVAAGVNVADFSELTKSGGKVDFTSKNEKREARNIVSLDELRAAAEKANEKAIGSRSANDEQELQKRSEQEVLDAPAPMLQSLLPQVSSISIFSGYLRDNKAVLERLDNKDGFTMFVAPTNKAFSDFSARTGLKPWEYPKTIQNDDTDDKVIEENIDFFVKAHTSYDIRVEPSNEMTSTLLNGEKIAIEHSEATSSYLLRYKGRKLPVLSVHSAENGIVFVIDTVLVQ